MSQELTITIDKEGKPTIAVKGASGKQCLDLTRDLEKALGDKVLDRTPTAEMNKPAATSTTQTAGLG